MSILYDLTPIQSTKNAKYHGGGVYAENLAKILIENKKDIYFLFDSRKKINLEKFGDQKKIDINEFKSEKELRAYIDENFRVIFSGNFQKRWQSLEKTVFFYPLHDMRDFEITINWSSLKLAIGFSHKIKRLIRILLKKRIRNYMFESLKPKKENCILTVSEYSKYSILSYYPHVNPDNIKVIAPLMSPQLSLSLEEEKQYLEELNLNSKEFFVILSANRWEKNAEIFIKAFDEIVGEFNINKKLVVVGLEKNVFKIKNHHNFKFIDYVDNKGLEILYKNCYIFCYPTLCEGFGYPPIEAMKYKVPILASACSSVLEVCGDSAVYFNPYSISEIKNKILQLTLKPKLYKEMCFKSKERYNYFFNEENKNIQKYLNIFE